MFENISFKNNSLVESKSQKAVEFVAEVSSHPIVTMSSLLSKAVDTNKYTEYILNRVSFIDRTLFEYNSSGGEQGLDEDDSCEASRGILNDIDGFLNNTQFNLELIYQRLGNIESRL